MIVWSRKILGKKRRFLADHRVPVKFECQVCDDQLSYIEHYNYYKSWIRTTRDRMRKWLILTQKWPDWSYFSLTTSFVFSQVPDGFIDIEQKSFNQQCCHCLINFVFFLFHWWLRIENIWRKAFVYSFCFANYSQIEFTIKSPLSFCFVIRWNWDFSPIFDDLFTENSFLFDFQLQ